MIISFLSLSIPALCTVSRDINNDFTVLCVVVYVNLMIQLKENNERGQIIYIL